MSTPSYLELLRTRTVVFDGAMGTSIQSRSPSAEDFGGEKLEGCNDHLVLSCPDLVREIHASFLEVGCDVLETNTFRANRFALKEYGLGEAVSEINRTAAQLAKRVAKSFSSKTHLSFVAGSIGPSGFLPSSSDPELGKITYEALVDGYREQAKALLQGGVDLLLIETGQDILEVKAAVTGTRRAMAEAGRRTPLQVQVTLDTSGRMLLGTDMPSAMVTLEALKVDVLGLNCSTGPEPMRGPVRFLSEHSRTPISVIPNAGIPHNLGGEAIYPLTPDQLARAHREFVEEMGVAVVGGCCGTTPDHLRAVVEAVKGLRRAPRPIEARVPRVSSAVQAIGLRQLPAPTLIGERVNAQGSRQVKELLLNNDYESILQVARKQVEGGAHVLDVCVAVTERSDEAHQMRTLVKLLSQGTEAPIMVDTTEVEVAAAALRQIPGRAILNSVHLEGGRERLDLFLPHVVEHGAALVALTIDESGMAVTADRKVAVAERIRDICIDEYGLDNSDLIFDALTFTLATGEEEYQRSAMETLEGIRRIKEGIPGVLTSLGVSNVSFGLHPQARSVLNSVFLHHAVEAGLDMAILNPAHITPIHEIEGEARELAEDLVFHRRPDALSLFIAFFEGHTSELAPDVDPRESMSVAEAIHWMILHRKRDGIEALVDDAIRDQGGGHDG
ncbi:MAG: homocysteine S-methyltransferase family protein, partial [Longimicrobiales bacterium]|nr:homocysteine S-methyltransferase family protein [Longimicrobiales bacterium]